jgi:hypothetical protein
MNGLTSNYNNYSLVELEKSLQSWVEPYPKPVILNHDMTSEPIGRVMAAKVDKESDGSGFIRLQIAITDPLAAQKIMDQRYLTGSVGGKANKAICSISGEDLAAEDANGRPRVPKYKRGQVYKGKLAFIDMQDISFKEYSFVNQPADQRSGVRKKASASGPVSVSDSDWVAKSSAFVLSMDKEDVYSLHENKSIFEGMNLKESRPVYLHLKGAFLSAMAIHESKNYNFKDTLLLSDGQENNKNEENPKMTVEVQEKDILAVSQELSDELSSIAADASNKEETAADEIKVEEKVAEEQVSVQNKTEENKDVSVEISDEKDVQTKADSASTEESTDATGQAQVQETKEDEKPQLNDKPKEGTVEQDAVSFDRVKFLEEENNKLKAALHRALAERVVDAKISAGMENGEERNELINDHSSRTASSLADSLKDIAKIPVKKSSGNQIPEITNESEGEKEDKVVSIDQTEKHLASEESSAEQIFVDALMGRRKL